MCPCLLGLRIYIQGTIVRTSDSVIDLSPETMLDKAKTLLLIDELHFAYKMKSHFICHLSLFLPTNMENQGVTSSFRATKRIPV